MRIEDYSLIGDCETAALIGKDGSIDWLCWPRFDSPACFARLLGTSENGCWRMSAPDPEARLSRSYRPGTLILETVVETPGGSAVIIDFMPPRDGRSDLVRMVVGRHGTVAFETELVLRTDYGRSVPWVNRCDERTLSAVAGPDMIVLRTQVKLRGEDMRTLGSFTVSEGETRHFVLTHVAATDELPEERDVEAALADTERFWREFSDRCPDLGRHGEMVRRSLITLKALTYEPTGGIIAAPTTSLPEWIGGARNWDYRYCWLRDATFTLLAFMNLGYYEEAEAWRDWLLRAVAGSPKQIQIMYGLSGERWLPECELPWLPGYEGSSPVRVGNAASHQLQLDVYGEVIDAMSQAARAHTGPRPEHSALRFDPRGRHIGRVMLEHLSTIWREPDYGIWEVRGPPRHFTHSKVMAWVAFDRAAKGAAARARDEDEPDWRALADAVHADVCRKGYDTEIGSFVQSYGSKALDASLLLLPLVGFLPASDPRVSGTVAAIETRLMRNGLLLRYETEGGVDGLPPDEGAFLACSFWLVDAYVQLGRTADANALFDRLARLCNDVGLLSEEYDPVGERMLGNFPQAFSHVGLIIAALNLSRAEGVGRDGGGVPVVEAQGA